MGWKNINQSGRNVLSGLMLICCSTAANAWHLSGLTMCDVNQNKSFDAGDVPFPGLTVKIASSSNVEFSGFTGSNGYYNIPLPDAEDNYTASLDLSSLPPDATLVQPVGNAYAFNLTTSAPYTSRDFLIDSPSCRQLARCWFTGGGVKFVSEIGAKLAEKGPQHSMGGNVFPGCNSEPGYGGQWNHVAHAMKLHFQGIKVNDVACGNVSGIPPGSTSPVTPFNFIEFKGTGTLKGIKGNKVDYGPVHFFARAEDRNEPGSKGNNDGAYIDRYLLHVYADPNNPSGTTLMMVDIDGAGLTVDPVTITGGNLQLHFSSCDNPP